MLRLNGYQVYIEFRQPKLPIRPNLIIASPAVFSFSLQSEVGFYLFVLGVWRLSASVVLHA